MGWTRLTGVGGSTAGVRPVERNEGIAAEVEEEVGSAVAVWSGSRIKCFVNCFGARNESAPI